jgi:signal transduction histidine kinase
VPAWTGSELVGLARTLDALHLRVRMADEVAERHRRTAETASAGMFELLAGLVEAEEGARGQLSAELHDTVAQSLMTARSLLADELPDLESAAELVAEAEEQVRAVMARTRPPALREGDLARAVAGLRDDLANRYALQVDVVWPQTAHPLPLVTAVTVYRFFQEGLLNVVKHADVDRAQAELLVDEDWVVAVVTDEGPGFDPEEVRSERGRHVGLGLLRERARLVGGSLEVSSWPANGTTLTLRLPRAAAAASGLLPMPRPRHSVA